jgi:hypothetical protein
MQNLCRINETSRILGEAMAQINCFCMQDAAIRCTMPPFHLHYGSDMQPRSDVVGSLLRPAWLLDARDRHERGELTPAAFKQIEDKAVDEAVALQESAGLDVITDGEMRRYAFYGHLVEELEGFDKFGGW